jgi:hypothetical protein
VWCAVVCDLETSQIRSPWPTLGLNATLLLLLLLLLLFKELCLCALLTIFYYGEHIEEEEVDGTCGLGRGQVRKEFGLGNLKVNRPL